MGNEHFQNQEEAASFFREHAQPVSTIEYNESHCKIVEAGIDSITSYYCEGDTSEKQALLFCMEKYLDPYYKNNLALQDEIVIWLKQEFYASSNEEVKEAIYDLLQYVDIDLPGYKLNDDGELVSKKWWQFWK